VQEKWTVIMNNRCKIGQLWAVLFVGVDGSGT